MGKITYLKCPLCNLNRPTKHRKVARKDGEEVIIEVTQHFRFYPDTEIIQMRERQPGNRGGFRLVAGAGVKISELAEKDPAVFQNLVEETRRLLAVLEASIR